MEVYDSLSDEVRIIRKGSRKRGVFFILLGLIFQIIFLFGYWSFLDETGSLAIIWLTIANNEYFPFTFILFVFGAGCILAAVRDFGWEESLIIKVNLSKELPGLLRTQSLFWWSRSSIILNEQIVVLRLHSILLDEFGVNKSHQVELEYREEPNSRLNTIIIYNDIEDRVSSRSKQLVEKIHRILELSEEIEITESSTLLLEKKKKGEKNNSKIS